MSELLAALAEQARGLRGLEAIAVAMALAYLVLAIRQNIWCWLGAAISTALYAYLMFEVRLYMESLLQVFYFGMAIYGWYSWYTGRHDGEELPVSVWPAGYHAIVIALVIAMSAATGATLQAYTDAEFPYVDSMTTWGAIWATFLVARKVLENWWYWLVIDVALVIIYWERSLVLTSMLFVVYVALIPVGWLSWRRSMQRAHAR